MKCTGKRSFLYEKKKQTASLEPLVVRPNGIESKNLSMWGRHGTRSATRTRTHRNNKKRATSVRADKIRAANRCVGVLGRPPAVHAMVFQVISFIDIRSKFPCTRKKNGNKSWWTGKWLQTYGIIFFLWNECNKPYGLKSLQRLNMKFQ